jgi:8-oxo-dGTP pyrophosphatase MutT (NUDIX family)
MQTFTCDKKCCSIKVDMSASQQPTGLTTCLIRRNYKKAGVFVFDPKEERVLLVQSRGQLWGCPKGSLELDESDTECAIREVKEETGLDIDPSNFTRATRIRNRAVYFYLEMDMKPVEIQRDVVNNDITGLTWIKLECLKECILAGHIVLNQHCKMVFSRFMDITFKPSDFIRVEKRRRRKKKFFPD